MGLWVGDEKDLLPPDNDNPKGNFCITSINFQVTSNEATSLN
jgi:hypothetical protein